MKVMLEIVTNSSSLFHFGIFTPEKQLICHVIFTTTGNVTDPIQYRYRLAEKIKGVPALSCTTDIWTLDDDTSMIINRALVAE